MSRNIVSRFYFGGHLGAGIGAVLALLTARIGFAGCGIGYERTGVIVEPGAEGLSGLDRWEVRG